MVDFTKSEMNKFDYKNWASYFAENDTQRLKIDFSKEQKLSLEVQKLIFPSIQAFQKGEGSDGLCLMKAVNSFVHKNGEKEYLQAMQLFIKEENWHSAYLRKYMDFYHIKTLKKSLLDSFFRKLRKLGGLKCEVTILVTAEMIALTYYDALSKCTNSSVLKSICNQMLNDEIPHIMFQSYTLSHFKVGIINKLIRKTIMTVTSIFVWCAFHNVYKTGGYSFRRYIKENLGYLHQSIYLTKINT